MEVASVLSNCGFTLDQFWFSVFCGPFASLKRESQFISGCQVHQSMRFFSHNKIQLRQESITIFSILRPRD